MLVLPFLETMITQACNLSCQGCTNYSDLKHQGYVTWDQGQKYLEPWLKRISILDFGIMGGEPFINPEWANWIIGIRQMLPLAQIRFTTNGLLLHKNMRILDIMQQVGNIVLKITVHTNDSIIEKDIEYISKAFAWEPVQEFGINRFVYQPNNIRLQINRPRHFLPMFAGSYETMRPWHSQPEQAFAACVQKTCPLLYQGNIYKCSTTALLADTLARFNSPNIAEWQQYLYQPLTPNCDDLGLQQFVDNFGKVHSVCGQCPDHTVPKLNHAVTVKYKGKVI